MKDNIKITPNIMPEEDIQVFIDYINNNFDKFESYEKSHNNPNRYALMFGKDQVFWNRTNTSLEKVRDFEPMIRKYFDIVCQTAQEKHGTGKLYVASFWFAKQFKDSFVHFHVDSGEVNQHFKISTIIYLNTLNGSGDLSFPRLKYTYSPTKGYMVSFPSQGEEYLHEVKRIDEERYSLVYWLTEDPYFAIN